MNFRQKEGGYYYGDPVADIFLPILVVFMVVMVVAVIFIPAVVEVAEEPPLSPGVYAAAEVNCVPAFDSQTTDTPDSAAQRCTLVIDVADQSGADEIMTTNHVLMLEPGEERAEVINLIDEPEVVDPEAVETVEEVQEGDGTTLTIEFK